MLGVVEADTLDDLMRSVFEALLDEGIPQESTRGSNLEVIGATLVLRNPRARLSHSESRRKVVSAVAELCWYLSGSDRADAIAFWIPKYSEYAEDDGHVHGAYGPRLFGKHDNAQVCRIVELLLERPGTRRAVIQLFDRRDVAQDVRFEDVPCTSTIQFLLRSTRIHMVVNMRSNDAYKGLPHDIFAFTMLQEVVARQLGVELGRYHHVVGSLHLYNSDRERAHQYLEEGWQSKIGSMPHMPEGFQCAHLSELLGAEAQLRDGYKYNDLHLPNEPYWADLVRLLALHRARKRHDPEEARAIIETIVDGTMKTFAQAAEL